MAQRFIDDSGTMRSYGLKTSAARAAITSEARNFTLSGEHIGIVEKPNIEKAREIAHKMIDLYSKAEIDAVYSASKRVQERDGAQSGHCARFFRWNAGSGGEQIDYIYEQPPQRIAASAAAALCGGGRFTARCSNRFRRITRRA